MRSHLIPLMESITRKYCNGQLCLDTFTIVVHLKRFSIFLSQSRKTLGTLSTWKLGILYSIYPMPYHYVSHIFLPMFSCPPVLLSSKSSITLSNCHTSSIGSSSWFLRTSLLLIYHDAHLYWQVFPIIELKGALCNWIIWTIRIKVTKTLLDIRCVIDINMISSSLTHRSFNRLQPSHHSVCVSFYFHHVLHVWSRSFTSSLMMGCKFVLSPTVQCDLFLEWMLWKQLVWQS